VAGYYHSKGLGAGAGAGGDLWGHSGGESLATIRREFFSRLYCKSLFNRLVRALSCSLRLALLARFILSRVWCLFLLYEFLTRDDT